MASKIKLLTDYNLISELDKLKAKWDKEDMALRALDRLNKYCLKNMVSLDDLINTHKNSLKKQKK